MHQSAPDGHSGLRSAARLRRGARRRKRRIITAIAAAVVMGSSGVAAGLWSATGSGAGSLKAATAQALTVTAAAAPIGDLYPGASGTLQFTVANPNPYAVTLTSIAYGATTSSNEANCPASNLTPAAGGALGTPITVPANGTSAAVSVPGALTLAATAPDACQGVTFTTAVTLAGIQA